MAERVSVALCTHNGVDHLDEQLRSVLAQSRMIDEIVLSDDASSDGTRELLESFRVSAPAGVDVVILKNDRPLGVTANFEAAIRATTGDVILLCDQDDRWASDKVESLLGLLAAPGALLAHSDARIIDGSGSPTGDTLFGALGVSAGELRAEERGDGARVLLRRNIVTGATAALRRELAEAAMPFPGSWVHDEWLAMLAAIGDGLRVSRRTLTDYRIHGGNQIGASRLTAGTAMGRLTASRAARNARLLARAEDLFLRVSADGSADRQLVAVLEAKVVHERIRSGYPAARPLRIVPVVRQALTGAYTRYGGGLRDVLRDLVQPA
ncbi:glycosyltransferase family 2 protein [Leifsonia shinshuensis]|uniref:glycosyltransferase family 2 protein n=1 Tax=Leifsonia shinshuensis TaxID=150026 RepID=UPI001F50C7C2|nr:glycosyltransferase family 2 protein [Leifsonia shinshuensis]MCI0158217.1 glycosyltransferase family 2 protein [Leifsonia shinshuensis]